MEYWRWWVVHLWVEGFFEVFATAAAAIIFARLGLVQRSHAGAAVIGSSALFLFAGIPGTFHHLYFSVAFLINPPIALYYMQGLNTTPVHGHTALFGVYGLLSLALTLIIARLLTGTRVWKESTLSAAFWCLNIGLTLMVGISLLPIGIAQAVASVQEGLWYARSAEFLQQPWLQQLRWMRIVGDSVFLVGVGAFVWFMLGLWAGWSVEPVGALEKRAAGAVPTEARA